METTLYARSDKHNKFYTVKLEERAGLWYLTGISGPIGGTAITQVKLKGKGVDYATGLKAYNSLINEKLTGGSGYEISNEAPGPRLTLVPERVGNLPSHMLLIDFAPGDLKRLIADPEWIFELKHDGHRCRVIVQDGAVTGISRQNLPMMLPKNVIDRIKAVNGVFDGELVKGKDGQPDRYFVFDILQQETTNWWRLPAIARAKEVLHLFPISDGGPVCGTSFADTPETKRHLFEWAHANGFEGIVAKKNIAYTAGKSGFALRLKFRQSASVICLGQHKDKSSFEMGLFDGSNRGSCTVYPNQTMPPTGAICEVAFLYLHDGVNGKIIQPRFLGLRDDVYAEDCTIDQFQVKGEKR